MNLRVLTIAGIVAVVCGGATAAPYINPVVSNMVYGGVEGKQRVQYRTEFQGNFYVGAKGALNLTSFKNKYYFNPGPATSESDSFSFVRQMGFDLTAGYQFAPQWRAELEYGYSGKFEDQDSVSTFKLSWQSVMANALYTISEWNTVNFYGGGGIGFASLTSRVSGLDFVTDGRDSQSNTAFAGQLILGIEEFLTPNFAIGAEFRMMYSGGITNKRNDLYGDTLVTETGGIFANSLKIGVRYKF